MKSKNTMGHLAALFTVAVWGTTLISTKVLLNAFQPVEILFFRFSLNRSVRWLRQASAESACTICWKTWRFLIRLLQTLG